MIQGHSATMLARNGPTRSSLGPFLQVLAAVDQIHSWLETCRDYHRAAAIYDELRWLSGAELRRRGLSRDGLARDICSACTSPAPQPRADHRRWNIQVLLALLIVTWALAYPSQSVASDDWPSRPIRLVVPFPAGGNTDAVARLTAEFMQKAIRGASIVVENHAGAGGIVATELVAKAAPDGHTLCMCSIGPI